MIWMWEKAGQSPICQNILGNFKDGLYDGDHVYQYPEYEKYFGSGREKKREEQRFETFEGRDLEGQVPICQMCRTQTVMVSPEGNKDQS